PRVPAAGRRAGQVHVGDGHAGVALLLPGHHDTVAAHGNAGGPRERAPVAGLHLAEGRAPVTGLRVSVVAPLVALDHAVATAHLGAGAESARHAGAARGLDGAIGGTAVAVGGVAVVAHLAGGDVDHAVAAAGGAHARH